MDQFPENWASTTLYESVAEELCGILKYLIAKTKTHEIMWKKIEHTEHTLVKSCVEDKALHHQGLIGNYTFELNCKISSTFSSDSKANLKVIHHPSSKEVNFDLKIIYCNVYNNIRLDFVGLTCCLINVIRAAQSGYVELFGEAKTIREELEKMEEVPQC